MWCEKFKCTMYTDACIKRVNKLLKGINKTENEHSFNVCKECLKGQRVKEHPECFINRDVEKLKKQYEQALEKEKENGKVSSRRKSTTKSVKKQRSRTRDKQNVSTSIGVRVKLKRKK